MRRDRQNDQYGTPAAVPAQTPPSAEDAFAVLPQNLTAAILIAFASKRGKRKVADGERTAIAHSQGRADHSWRNRHFAYAAEEAELGSLESLLQNSISATHFAFIRRCERPRLRSARAETA